MQNTFFLHAAWLVQTFVHWPIFLTAASRRSLVRVSVPVWGIILSEPLPIVVLVSRYLTNKLIGRMPIYNHRSFKIPTHASSKYYRVLIRISSGYPPVIGRLHTCYAPVRRFLLPESNFSLDLHVLGLPLAFILSQDQTLHCKNFDLVKKV